MIISYLSKRNLEVLGRNGDHIHLRSNARVGKRHIIAGDEVSRQKGQHGLRYGLADTYPASQSEWKTFHGTFH